jgi:pyridoxal phosphate enzyme (YggS family)
VAADTPTARWHTIQEQIADAAKAVGRTPGDITTIVVTKFHPSSLVRELVAAGVEHVGENRHQEASAKFEELRDVPLTWHFVGQLQSNKAKAVAQYCSVIHSLDRPSLTKSLSQSEKDLDVFLEVNLTDVPGRGGVEPEDMLSLAEGVLATENLLLRGLMAVAPVDEDPRVAFDRVLVLQQQLWELAPRATDLSLGMSGDFVEAISRGATHLRIGSAITGKRPDPTYP